MKGKKGKRGQLLSDIYREIGILGNIAKVGNRKAIGQIVILKRQVKNLQRIMSEFPERKVIVEKKKRSKKR